jgi:hypothetical protein
MSVEELASLARDHWTKWLPTMVNDLRERGQLEEALHGAASLAQKQIDPQAAPALPGARGKGDGAQPVHPPAARSPGQIRLSANSKNSLRWRQNTSAIRRWPRTENEKSGRRRTSLT